MAMGRPRKPVELKKLEGTYRKDRDTEAEKTALLLENRTKVILPEETKVRVPKSLTDKVCRKFWKEEVSNLLTMRVLSMVDLQQLETMCITLQKLREVQSLFVQMSPLEDGFDDMAKRFERLSNKFDALASKFYVSPQARTQLKLNDLALIKTAQEIKKNESVIGSILENRQ